MEAWTSRGVSGVGSLPIVHGEETRDQAAGSGLRDRVVPQSR